MISPTKNRVQAHELTFECFLDAPQIQERVVAMGQQIAQDYRGRKPVFLSVLNGAFIFSADLIRACDVACETSFIRVASYEGTSSTGAVKSILGLDMTTLQGRDVIVVEDIIDSGRTLHWLLNELKQYQPASVALCALLLKPDALEFDLPQDYIGFEIPNKFVVGYGLDYNGEGRNFPAIYQLVEEE